MWLGCYRGDGNSSRSPFGILVFEIPGTAHFDVAAADAVAMSRDDAHRMAATMATMARENASAATQHQEQNAE